MLAHVLVGEPDSSSPEHALGAAASAGLDDAIDPERRVLAPPNAAMVEEARGIIDLSMLMAVATIVRGEGNRLGLIPRA